MYNTLLSIHSLFRWLVLISLLYAIYRAWRGWKRNKPYTKHDNLVRHLTATIAHIQLVLGLWLYFVSPVIHYFLHNYKDAVHQREVRFFGMEHSLMMLIAIVLITIGSMVARRKATDQQKFKAMAIWFTIALIVILILIPWPFSPITANRPYVRPL
jgi:cytochrome c biogenesis factor